MGSEKRRILCVEDNRETRQMISAVLKGFEVVLASTKSEALEIVKKDRFSLFVLDYYLPDGTGEELCRHIRGFDKRTPIVFITGAPAFTETKARAMGAQGTVRKGNPMFLTELRERAAELT